MVYIDISFTIANRTFLLKPSSNRSVNLKRELDSIDSFIADDIPKNDDEQYPGDGNDSGNEVANFSFDMTTE